MQSQDWIPFHFQIPLGHIHTEKLTYERQKWLKQRRAQEYETYEEQFHPKPLSVELTYETRFYDSKYIRYCANESELLYISEGGLSSKSSRFISEDEERARDLASR